MTGRHPELPALRPLRRWLDSRANPRSDDALARSALVVAPHPDDETLGCGGTVLRKREVGAHVQIVFMTDGSRSHQGRMDEQELRALRMREALEATQALGCADTDAIFLDFPDGRLSRHRDAARQAIAAVIEQVQPDEVYVPFRHDGPADHETTFEVVHEALACRRVPTRVYEYPIWFWSTWPWIRVPALPAGVRKFLRSARRGLQGFQHFRSSVYIGDVLDRKAAALQCHRSQMSQPEGEEDWPVLGDVAGGDFLGCFFSEFEVFRATSVGGDTDAAR